MATEPRRRLGVGCFAPRERLLGVLARMALGPPARDGGFGCGEEAALAPPLLSPAATGFFLEQSASGIRLFVFERNRPGGPSPETPPAGALSAAVGSATEPENPVRREEPWTSAGST